MYQEYAYLESDELMLRKESPDVGTTSALLVRKKKPRKEKVSCENTHHERYCDILSHNEIDGLEMPGALEL